MFTVDPPADPSGLATLAESLPGVDHLVLTADGVLVVPVEGAEVDEAAVRDAIAAHVPPTPEPDPDEALRDAISKASTIADLKAALLGTGRPAAVAGRPHRPD